MPMPAPRGHVCRHAPWLVPQSEMSLLESCRGRWCGWGACVWTWACACVVPHTWTVPAAAHAWSPGSFWWEVGAGLGQITTGTRCAGDSW